MLDTVLEEGTWMQPDVSPDGRTILFDLLGDIYALDVNGGNARPVLTGVPFETHPVFSPDGRQFAFISDRSGVTNLWIAAADGSNPRALSHERDLTVFTSPAWSPDGKAVYVSRMKHAVLAFELWKFDVEGGEGSAVIKAQPNGEGWDERINALGAALSPDGRYIYYARKVGTTWTEKHPPNWSIARHDLQSHSDNVIIDAAGGAMHPALSHDGRYLAYASRSGAQTGLRLRNLATGEDRWIALPVDHDAQEQGYYADLTPRFTFAPGDKSLIASVGGKIDRIEIESGHITVVPFTAHVQLGLGALTRVEQREETGAVRVRVNLTPRESPDGRRIAFTALGTLYVQELRPGARPQALRGAQRQSFQPSWSPDGKHLVYVTWDALSGGAVWEIAAAGGPPVRLTDEVAFYTEPHYSLDGENIVALRASHYDRLRAPTEISPERATDLIRLPARGGEVTLIAHTFGARLLDFASDPQRVRFYAPEGASSIRLDGTDLRRELIVRTRAASKYVGVPIPVEELRLNAAGNRALARTASQLYLLDVPAAKEGKPAEIDLTQTTPGAVKLTRIGADFFAWADGGRTIEWSLGSQFRRIALAAVDTSTPGSAEGRAQTSVATVAVARDVPQGTLVLRGATVVTMRGSEVIPSADVLVINNRIAAVGATGTVQVPRSATLRDVTGKFIVPGLVDAHAHWFEIRRQLHDDQMWDLLANLAYGVTSGLDPQPFTTDVLAYQDMIDAGLMPGPRAWSTGPGVFNNSEILSQAAAADVLTRYRDYYRTRNIKSYMVGDRERRQYMVEAAKALGMMPTTEGASDLDLDLTHAIDGFSGNEHALPVTALHEDVIRLFAEGRTSLVPTLSVLYGGEPALFDFIIERRPQQDEKFSHFVPPGVVSEKIRNRRWMPAQLQTYSQFAADALRIQRRGGLIGVGSHGEIQGLGFHWEMEVLASGGATPFEILHAATLGSAEVIGHARDVGSLEPGKLADLLILDADPLADIRHTQSIHWIMKNGRLYEANTLSEVWPRVRPLPALWFWSDVAAVGGPAGREPRDGPARRKPW
jgi:Tol biopolymer transport system component/imidazolonepropionase-like amidohydrolase